VTGDGMIHAKIFITSRQGPRPYFIGRVSTERDGVLLEGLIRESAGVLVITWTWLVMATIFAALGALLLAARQFTNPGTYVCSVFALVCALVALRSRTKSAPLFARLADELEDAIRDVLVPRRRLPHVVEEVIRELPWVRRRMGQ
jgi:hypothetical protein